MSLLSSLAAERDGLALMCGCFLRWCFLLRQHRCCVLVALFRAVASCAECCFSDKGAFRVTESNASGCTSLHCSAFVQHRRLHEWPRNPHPARLPVSCFFAPARGFARAWVSCRSPSAARNLMHIIGGFPSPCGRRCVRACVRACVRGVPRGFGLLKNMHIVPQFVPPVVCDSVPVPH